jgi:hypothetical protein
MRFDIGLMSMPVLTLAYAASLMVVGLAPYLMTGQKTALIPAGFGVLVLIAGLVAQKESLRKHGIHAAAFLSLLGTLLPLGRLIPSALSGNLPSALAIFSMSAMAVISGTYLFLCIRSFIAARKAREAAAAEDQSSQAS